ncbi:DUF7147 family protein [Fictibacillus terranigra]|uniref:Methylthioribose kinase n=1 Tax=Fictibacillus terranigra TaxID=3058424 RepID=A0ABT8E6M6_9BACL|nr:methylthioribose kinase [Fictibacillus sp. CENA-BCM004]MDN4073561.1 methylthioribose kinase [Fictibacillus sp. CENA-BCM004]
MIQRFIELGEGYSDIYELMEIAETNKRRVSQLLCLRTEIHGNPKASFIVVLDPANEGNFQPLYICREGIPADSKRFKLFEELSRKLEKEIIMFDVKPSGDFGEKELYYHYLTGILRLNYLIPPLS